ncbi:MAG: hypothetical protein CME34_18845 [Gordonia sp.]|nr:hypothetical protein [Gordonia sp. (in: high G+C Gram-positive bacteria)]
MARLGTLRIDSQQRCDPINLCLGESWCFANDFAHMICKASCGEIAAGFIRLWGICTELASAVGESGSLGS